MMEMKEFHNPLPPQLDSETADLAINELRLSIATPVAADDVHVADVKPHTGSGAAFPVASSGQGEHSGTYPQTTFLRALHGHVGAVQSMALHLPNDGSDPLLVTGGDDGTAIVWNLKTHSRIRDLDGVHTHLIRGLAVYSPPAVQNADAAVTRVTSDIAVESAHLYDDFDPKDVQTARDNYALAYSPLAVTGSDDKTATIWDINSGRPLRRLIGQHSWFITSVAIFQPSGRTNSNGQYPHVVTAAFDRYLVVWNSFTAERIMSLAGEYHNSVSSVVSFVSPYLRRVFDGESLAEETADAPFILSVGFDKSIALWDSVGGEQVCCYSGGHTDIISCADVYIPREDEIIDLPETAAVPCLLTGSYDKTAILWKLEDGERARTLTGHSDWVTSVKLHVSKVKSSFLALSLTGSHDGSTIMWDMAHARKIRVFNNSAPITGVLFLPETEVIRIAGLPQKHSSSRKSTMKERESQKLLRESGDRRTGTIRNESNTSLNTMVNNPMNPTIDKNKEEAGYKHNKEFDFEELFPIVMTTSEDHIVRIYNFNSSQSCRLSSCTSTSRPAFGRSVSSKADVSKSKSSSGKGSLRNTSDKSNPVSLANSSGVSAGIIAQFRPMLQHDNWVISLFVFSPTDDRKPLLISGGSDDAVIVWDLLATVGLKRFEKHCADVSGVRAMELRKADLSYYEAESKSSSSGGTVISFSHDDYVQNEEMVFVIISSSYDGYVHLWDYDRERVLISLKSPDLLQLSAIEVSLPTDDVPYAFIVCATLSHVALVWNVFSGELVFTLAEGNSEYLTSCAIYRPDADFDEAAETLILTASCDSSIAIWGIADENARNAADNVVEKPHQRRQSAARKGGHRVRGSARGSEIATSGRLIRVLRDAYSDRIKALIVFTPSNFSSPQIITAGYDRTVAFWDLKTGVLLNRLVGGHSNWVTSLCICSPVRQFRHPQKLSTRKDTDTVSTGSSYVNGLDNNRTVDEFLVSGGYDGVPVVWDIQSGQIIKKLEGGHTDAIRSIAVYNGSVNSGTDSSRVSPIVITCGHDGHINLWDSLYPFSDMPPRQGVLAAFNLDLNESSSEWPRISALAAQFGLSLWIENFCVFRDACRLRRSDFLVKFQEPLAEIIEELPDVVPGKSMLRFAIESQDLQSLRIILRCWVYSLNKDIPTPFDSFQHASHQLPLEEVLLLGRQYPAEFCNFICALKVVQMGPHPGSANHVPTAALGRSDKSRMFGCMPLQMENIWQLFAEYIEPTKGLDPDICRLTGLSKKLRHHMVSEGTKFKSTSALAVKSIKKRYNELAHGALASESPDAGLPVDTSHSAADVTAQDDVSASSEGSAEEYDNYGIDYAGQPVTMAFVPLLGISSVEMLTMLVKVSEALDSVAIFESEAGKYAAKYAWDTYGNRIHVGATMGYMAFLALYSIWAIFFPFWSNLSLDWQFAAYILYCVVMSFTCYRIFFETSKCYALRKANSSALIIFFTDFWNLFDIINVLFLILSIIARFWPESMYSRIYVAVTIVMLYFKGMYYLRPYQSSGPLVSMVLTIAFDMRTFTSIVLLTLIGFAFGFYIMSYPNRNLPFGQLDMAILNCFSYMLGNYDFDFSGTASPFFSTVLMVIFLIFMAILMLNLLIALMGDTFARVSGRGIAQWRLEQLSILLDERFLGNLKEDPCKPAVFALMYTAKYEAYLESWEEYESENLFLGLKGESQSSQSASTETEKIGWEQSSTEANTAEQQLERRMEALEEKVEDMHSKLDLILKKLQ